MNGAFKISSALKGVVVNTGWLLALRILRILFAFFVSAWMARHLGPSLWGTLNYAFALVILFGPLTRLGLESVVVHELVRTPGKREEILGTTLLLRIIGALVSFGGVVAVVSLLRPGDTTSMLLVSIVSFGMIFQAYDAVDLFFQAEEQLRYPVYAKSVALALSNLAKIILILMNAPLAAFAAAAALETIAGAAGLVLVYRARGFRMSAWKATREQAKGLLSLGWPMILSGAFAVVYFKIDQVMLGQMIDEAEVGIYANAAKISEMWFFVPVAISTALFPVLVQSKKQGPEIYRARTQQLYDFLVWVSLSVAVVMTFAADRVVLLVFGPEYARSGPMLAIHIWGGIFIFLREALGRWFITENLLSFAFISNGFGAVANVILNYFLIPLYGGTGAAVATVISYAAAGYFACFIHPKTREAAWMMSKALVVPLRSLVGALRSMGRGE